MKPQYTLRPAGESDRSHARSPHHAAMRQAVEAMWGWDDARQDALFDRDLVLTDRWIVQIGDRDVGTVRVTRGPAGFFLDDIQILPDAQGRDLGTTLIRAVQDEVSAVDAPVDLRVNLSNRRARELYERPGFVVVGRTQTHDLMRWLPGSRAR